MDTANQPLEKSQNPVADFHDEIRQIELEGYALTVKKARNALFWAAGLVLLGEVVGLFSSGAEPEIFGIGFIILVVGSLIFLALWTKKKPYTAIISGIIVYCLYILLNAVAYAYLEGTTGLLKGIFGGIIFKIIILVTLIRPLNDARELQRETPSTH